jgi:hypothetical protein
MSALDYLSVLISFILALGMTRVLAGVGEMLQASSHRLILLGCTSSGSLTSSSTSWSPGGSFTVGATSSRGRFSYSSSS